MTELRDEGQRMGRRGLIGAAAAGAGVAAAGLAAAPAYADRGSTGGHHGGRGPGVRTGAERAQADGWRVFAGQRIGVITNPTGVVRDASGRLVSIVDVMAASHTVEIGGVFGPEHGFRGTAQAGEAEETYVDERTGVTVYDAYGATAEKFAELFDAAQVDTVVFDIQDAGARFYTYIWTLYAAMTAAARTRRRLVVLDRPNPVGGTAKGPVLRDGFTSGVGQDEIAQQHGLTVGELARLFNGEFMPTVAGAKVGDLDVVELTGWRPSSLFADTGLTWVMPSPNVPTPDTALLYPGTCLFEATNLSEGRGTTRPFELLGAPYVDHRWAEALTRAKLPGVEFREAYFTPTFSKNANLVCGGVQVHQVDRAAIDAPRIATHLLTTLRDLYADFGWRTGDSYSGRWIDLLTGSDRFRLAFDAGADAETLIAAWRDELRAFDRTRQRYLLYRR